MTRPKRDPKTLRYAARLARRQLKLAEGSVLSEWFRLDLLARQLVDEARKIEKKVKPVRTPKQSTEPESLIAYNLVWLDNGVGHGGGLFRTMEEGEAFLRFYAEAYVAWVTVRDPEHLGWLRDPQYEPKMMAEYEEMTQWQADHGLIGSKRS